MTRVWVLIFSLLLAAPLGANAAPVNARPYNAAVDSDLPPMPSQEKEGAISQGMLLASMAVALILLATAGGIAVYVTRRHQAVPTVKDI